MNINFYSYIVVARVLDSSLLLLTLYSLFVNFMT